MPSDKKLNAILKKAGKRAIGGGTAGALAMGVQVCSLMWLRTTMNYQYRYGASTTEALSALYKQGGVRRFYRGIAPALIQGPLSRFGDTAANAGVLALLDNAEFSKNLPTALKTTCASATAAMWRIFLMPVDACKTIMQVEGKNGISMLASKVRAGGPGVLYHGALAAYGATFVGHFPWFYTFNQLNVSLPKTDNLFLNLCRNGVMGFTASAVSDTCSNSIRVLKTKRQTASEALSYMESARQVIKADGLVGLFGRGLKTRILANGLQSCMFAVLWKQIESMINKKKEQEEH